LIHLCWLLPTACVVCAQEHHFSKIKRDISAFAFPGEINHPNPETSKVEFQPLKSSTSKTANTNKLWWKMKSTPDQSKGMTTQLWFINLILPT
jgi:hypothetical protein